MVLNEKIDITKQTKKVYCFAKDLFIFQKPMWTNWQEWEIIFQGLWSTVPFRWGKIHEKHWEKWIGKSRCVQRVQDYFIPITGWIRLLAVINWRTYLSTILKNQPFNCNIFCIELQSHKMCALSKLELLVHLSFLIYKMKELK